MLGGVIVALVGSIGGYIGAARKLSGKIDTSEAGELWAESRSIRDDYRDRLDAANQRQAGLEARVAQLEKRNNELAERNVRLLEEQLDLQRACSALRDERDKLAAEVAALKSRIGDRRQGDRTGR